MPEEQKGDRIWLVLCIFTGIAVDVTLNKYSSTLPGMIVLLLWAVPAIIFVIWLWRVERTRAWVKDHFLEHPVSYFVMFLILIPFGWQATSTLFTKLTTSRPKQQVVVVNPVPTVPVSNPPAPQVSTRPNEAEAKPNHKVKSHVPNDPKSGTTVAGDVDQSGDGCQIKNVGGSNNSLSNVCAPEPVNITDAQTAIAIKDIKKNNGISGSVVIMYEGSAEGGNEVAGQLKKILDAIGVESRIDSAMMSFVIPYAASYPGLSFGYPNQSNKNLADAIEKSLLKAHVIAKPMNPTKRDVPGTQQLYLIIRKS